MRTGIAAVCNNHNNVEVGLRGYSLGKRRIAGMFKLPGELGPLAEDDIGSTLWYTACAAFLVSVRAITVPLSIHDQLTVNE